MCVPTSSVGRFSDEASPRVIVTGTFRNAAQDIEGPRYTVTEPYRLENVRLLEVFPDGCVYYQRGQ